jgi:membrane-associated HD superfamily phosphohydrolase
MDNQMIIKGDWKSFLDLPGEELLLVKRKHPLVVVYPIMLVGTLALISLFVSYFIFTQLIVSMPLFFASILIILSMYVSTSIFTFIYWYFHLYILTTRKILEVRYTPLFSHVVNDIFLDNVNCTEVDLNSNGFLNEMADMGDIIITFDRPTHQEEFALQDIKGCDAVGKFLTQKLMVSTHQGGGSLIWMRGRKQFIGEAA